MFLATFFLSYIQRKAKVEGVYMKKEMFIHISGEDRSGKTTLGKMLFDFLTSHSIEVHWRDEIDGHPNEEVTGETQALALNKIDRERWNIKISS